MDQRQLAAFVAVAEELNFTRAAQRLFVVQSTLSASVRSLETELGVPLFERSTRRVSLTPAGESMLPEARGVLDAFDRMHTAADDTAAGLRGRVRVGTFSGLDVIDLPRLLGDFHARHPLVDLALRTSATGSSGLAEELRRGRLEAALLALPPAELAGLDAVVVARVPFVVLLPREHELAGRDALRPEDLDGERLVDTPSGFGNRDAVDRAFQAAGLARRVATEVVDLSSVSRFVAAGLGAAVVPAIGIDTTAAAVQVPLDWDGPDWVLSVCTDRTVRRSPAVDALIALVADRRGGWG